MGRVKSALADTIMHVLQQILDKYQVEIRIVAKPKEEKDEQNPTKRNL